MYLLIIDIYAALVVVYAQVAVYGKGSWQGNRPCSHTETAERTYRFGRDGRQL